VTVTGNQQEEATSAIIQVDEARLGEEAIEVDGIPFFIDSNSKEVIANHMLDCMDDPEDGLFFMLCGQDSHEC